MKDNVSINNFLDIDEFVNDYEFTDQLFKTDISEFISGNKKVIWADFI